MHINGVLIYYSSLLGIAAKPIHKLKRDDSYILTSTETLTGAIAEYLNRMRYLEGNIPN